jgi:predicted nucleic acid-binding protein
MVVIHLARITLLGKSCEYFKNVVIPRMVYDEILSGKEKGYPEVKLIVDLIEAKKITVREVRNRMLVKKLREFNIERGEAESVALYWEEKADYLATDDDNVRKKSMVLNIKLIGTPAIILKLYKEKLIEKEKFEETLAELRKIGWFSDAVIDKVLMEGLK